MPSPDGTPRMNGLELCRRIRNDKSHDWYTYLIVLPAYRVAKERATLRGPPPVPRTPAAQQALGACRIG